ncbi:hypothetical protein MHM98_10410 [Psychrobium sp. MM17-31]|uniref:hypothetical protein n=1 Tax=Psychrobium sp. MM17-31 TaxID=2917758 RepID=UPI001EF56257|nr:hypothetical protein [Psychrobium sp. MM17-31]MCG7531754.1 hypothetical protein [Psychrobium sp. MM17-31]
MSTFKLQHFAIEQSVNAMAEVLACQLTDEPMPLPQSLLDQLNPNRYWIKQFKKHNVDI